MMFKQSPFARGGVALAVVLVVSLIGGRREARADLIAAFVQGHGGISSVQVDGSAAERPGSAPAVGVQAGARLLGLEAYGDYTSFGGGAAIQRAILGLRLGFEIRDTRLELRAGGGLISEYGGALVGPLSAPNRMGVVARLGVNLERRVSDALLMGFGINAESFVLDASAVAPTGALLPRDGWIRGSDLFASLHLKFEIGI